MMKAFNVNENTQGLDISLLGDGTSTGCSFTLGNPPLDFVAFGPNPPSAVNVNLVQDSTGLAGLTVSAVISGSTLSITFNQTLPLGNPNLGPFVQLQITWEYNSLT